jgi:phage tail-like protein
MSLATSRPLYEAFNFHVSLGQDDALFTTFGPLRTTVSVVTYREAGAILPIKDPNDIDFENVTLTRGVSKSRVFYDWINSVINSVIGTTSGLAIKPSDYVKNLTVYQRDRTKKTIQKYYMYNAFPVECVAGDWDNTKDEVLFERVTLAYQYFIRVDV